MRITEAPKFKSLKEQGIRYYPGKFFLHGQWKVRTMRAYREGYQFGSPSRGGTWYEIARGDSASSTYVIKEENISTGDVGGYVLDEETQTIHRPLWVDKEYITDSGLTDGLFELLELKKENARKYLRGESGYAANEIEIARWLRKHNYDSVVFYTTYTSSKDVTGYEMFIPRTQIEFLILDPSYYDLKLHEYTHENRMPFDKLEKQVEKKYQKRYEKRQPFWLFGETQVNHYLEKRRKEFK